MPANGTLVSVMALRAALYFRRQTSRPQASENRLATLLEEISKQRTALIGQYAALNFEAVVEGQAVA